jgi:CRP-like cAMP-binding protein
MAVRSRQPLPAPVTAQVAAHALFAGLDQPTLAVLLPELELIELPAGAALFAEGDPGDALYLVVSGRLRVARAAPGGEHAVREIGRGELVGEFALLTGEPRSATVRAVRDSNLVRLSQALFERLLQRYPQAMTQIARSIVQRVRGLERGAPAGAAASVFAILPAGDVPLATFAHDLAEALAAFGPTLHLSSAQCEQLFGEPGIAQIDDDHPRNSALVGWLSEQETHYRQIVYLADHTWTPWTRRCLRQADRLLLVGQAAADPAPTRLELRGRRAGARRASATAPGRRARRRQHTGLAYAARHPGPPSCAAGQQRRPGAAGAPANRPGDRGGARRRRRAWHCAHRRAPRARRGRPAGRLYWRHQHWRADRRAVRQRA